MKRMGLAVMLFGSLVMLLALPTACVVRSRPGHTTVRASGPRVHVSTGPRRHHRRQHARPTNVTVNHTPPPPDRTPPPPDRTPPPPDRTPPPPAAAPAIHVTVDNPTCRRGENLHIGIAPWRPDVLVYISGKPVPKRVTHNRIVVTVPGNAPTGPGVVEVVWQGQNHAVPVRIVP